MKKTFFILGTLSVIVIIVKAQSWYFPSNSSTKSNTNIYQYKDLFNNSYKSYENLWKDSDKDGFFNYYDRHDKNPNVGFHKTPTFTTPSFYYNYKSSSYDLNSGRSIYEGPKGGKYYVNSNGNKTYIKKSKTYGW